MSVQNYFNRYEVKYLIKKDKYLRIIDELKNYMVNDEYGKSTICNIYYDTPDFRLIRKSIEKPLYKEKLRLRSYGIPNDDTIVFFEMKKKYNSVVYKRRECLTLNKVEDFIKNNDSYSQISKEISYLFNYYQRLYPALYLSYNRVAYYGNNNRNLRITFDSNIIWRDYDIDLKKGSYGNSILPEDMVLMEIKVDTALPLWLTAILTKEKIFPCSFSKYGNSYLSMIEMKEKEGKNYA